MPGSLGKRLQLRPMWERLNLSARLMVGSGAALLVFSAVLLYSIVETDAAQQRRELSEKLESEIEFIVPAIAEQAVIGDYALIEQMLKARADLSFIARAVWIDPRGSAVTAAAEYQRPKAPGWFKRWADLPAREVTKPIEVGGERYGRVFLELNPVPTLDALWEESIELFQMILFGFALLFSVTLAIANNALRPLVSLAHAAMRFGKGDHALRIEVEGPPEVRASITAFNSMANNIEGLLTSLNDSRTTLFAEKERAQVTLASIGDAVVTSDLGGRVEYMNPVAESLTGWPLAEAVGQPLSLVLPMLGESGDALATDPVDAALRDAAAGEAPRHAVLIARHGAQHPIEHTAAPIRNRDGVIAGAVLAFRDVGESRKMARQLSWQATHDSLTGLVNRAEFERRLNALVEQSNRDGGQHALLYLDLDQFKVVNDTCGHVAGDELLRQVTGLLQQGIRDSDTLARLGGDEFGVLLSGCPVERAVAIAENLRQSLAQFRFAWQDKSFVVGISVGVVSIAGAREQSARVMAAADAACYSAKDKGRNRVQVYLESDTELAQRQGEMQWISRLIRAMEENRLILYCQRIAPAQRADERETHHEVLLRMVDEHGKIVPPMAFIPAAERYNLMATIDRRVVARTFETAAHIHAQRRDPPTVLSINLSGASLNDETLLRFITDQFSLHGIPPRMICFEITETTAIANLTRTTRLISELRKLGCRFSLDDFGSGLSSFAYLKNLPVDYLKIDGGFVKDMVRDPISRAMVKAIHDIGHVLGIQTIAEWVDNDDTLALLRQMGVDYVQGYGVGKPVPLESIRPVGGLVSEARLAGQRAKRGA
jgi:diguanylate cyclase (GGDEF)-like protein/PAS domain S-box-containing protein